MKMFIPRRSRRSRRYSPNNSWLPKRLARAGEKYVLLTYSNAYGEASTLAHGGESSPMFAEGMWLAVIDLRKSARSAGKILRFAHRRAACRWEICGKEKSAGKKSAGKNASPGKLIFLNEKNAFNLESI